MRTIVRLRRLAAGMALVYVLDPAVARPARPDEIAIKIGPQVTILSSGALGLTEFPDGAIAIVGTRSLVRLLLSSGVSSFLVEGSSLDSLKTARCVLKPGRAGEYDNGYAGICGVYRHRDAKLYAFYHAEDQEGMKRFGNLVPGYYSLVGAAVSGPGATAFEKLGPVVTSAQVKDPNGMPDQGCGEMCVVRDKTGRYLLMYYADHSRINGRGVQICLARSPVGKRPPVPGTWKKYCRDGFTRDGLGGEDTPVVSVRSIPADATFPHVTYSGALRKYVMVFNIVAYLEHPVTGHEGRPEQSGIYTAYSDDGIAWSDPRQLIKAFSIPFKGRELAWHPTLIWDGEESLTGWLVYSYTPVWGYVPPQESPHYMVGRRVEFRQVSTKVSRRTR